MEGSFQKQFLWLLPGIVEITSMLLLLPLFIVAVIVVEVVVILIIDITVVVVVAIVMMSVHHLIEDLIAMKESQFECMLSLIVTI